MLVNICNIIDVFFHFVVFSFVVVVGAVSTFCRERYVHHMLRTCANGSFLFRRFECLYKLFLLCSTFRFYIAYLASTLFQWSDRKIRCSERDSNKSCLHSHKQIRDCNHRARTPKPFRQSRSHWIPTMLMIFIIFFLCCNFFFVQPDKRFFLFTAVIEVQSVLCRWCFFRRFPYIHSFHIGATRREYCDFIVAAAVLFHSTHRLMMQQCTGVFCAHLNYLICYLQMRLNAIPSRDWARMKNAFDYFPSPHSSLCRHRVNGTHTNEQWKANSMFFVCFFLSNENFSQRHRPRFNIRAIRLHFTCSRTEARHWNTHLHIKSEWIQIHEPKKSEQRHWFYIQQQKSRTKIHTQKIQSWKNGITKPGWMVFGFCV